MISKSKNPEEDGLRTLGTILELVGVPILIIVAVLQKISNQDLGVISVLLVVGVCMFFVGLMLSHLPRQSEKEKEKKNEKAMKNGEKMCSVTDL
ncbi:hypothetical protein MUO83_06170 [Candidatus Bathyarchaeota archaeon]|jgi:uncharacterized membrane protein|nr:hypothetical protein [Candidatus Bathyarchaeota archaeon]